MLPFPACMLLDSDQGTESEFTFANLDVLVLASLVLTARSALLGTFCKLLDSSLDAVDLII